MLCATHRLIAHKVYEALKAEFNIFIDYEALLNGSIAPDVSPSMIIIPHTKNKSQKFLNKQINWLLDARYEESKNISEFSYRLGIVIHLISDYFCTSHNDIKYLNPILHYIYENRFGRYFKKQVHRINMLVNSSTNNSFECIIKYIDESHRQYTQCKTNMENDYLYSLDTVLSISQYIISNQLAKYNAGIFAFEMNLNGKTA